MPELLSFNYFLKFFTSSISYFRRNKKLHELNVPTKRLVDYYAEMAKSDRHMEKVKEALLSKEAELEKRDKVRKFRELKKIGKQFQMENTRNKLF
jgi:rRNA-processing protein EBP2